MSEIVLIKFLQWFTKNQHSAHEFSGTPLSSSGFIFLLGYIKIVWRYIPTVLKQISIVIVVPCSADVKAPTYYLFLRSLWTLILVSPIHLSRHSCIRSLHMKLAFCEMFGWQLSNCGFFLENQRQFFHGT